VRTTVTLDADVVALVKKAMAAGDRSFKAVVNDGLRAGLTGGGEVPPYRTPTFRMGFNPAVPWDKALHLAGVLEDDELIRRLAVGK
jgi:hypothetical protein